MHKTAATPLALICAALIVYASLYPFADWRDQGMEAWSFLLASPPRYWTGFDVAINLAGYVPFGGLLALSAMRAGRSSHPVLFALLVASLLSLCLETLQSFLPVRVASREDWLLNAAGAWLGAFATLALERLGAIDRWSHFRMRWFVRHSRGGLVLLATWPLALLFPPAVPFGLGQVFERIEAEVADQLADTPFLVWLPVRDIELQPLLPSTELLCVMLGLLIPCLLGFCVIRPGLRRLLFVPLYIGLGTLVTALSAILSWGPGHAWAWLDLPSQVALVLALLLAVVLSWAPSRVFPALVLLGLGVYLSILNQAPENPYFAQTLQAWEQGRFIRFNGLAQWLGWLWPYAVLGYALSLIWQHDAKN
ncbi:VanZ family protein [Rhodoferax lacus]|uniref:VanZ family protein n=1 Tax=Rhodoferax lacus TaxID=2184758 RepID=A0A3E1R777_9BURK|nr:VanZ family protein [Rhodoferax lacus]RFO95225.1 VanZ family protein [Rhodoferax lacus]